MVLRSKPVFESLPDGSSTSSRQSFLSSPWDSDEIDSDVSALLMRCRDAAIDAVLQSTPLTEFLRGWIALILSCDCNFGSYVRMFTTGTLHFIATRCRDVLPLPLMRGPDIEHWVSLVEADVAPGLLNLAIPGLNFLFGVGSFVAVPTRPTALHKHVIRRLVVQIDFALRPLRGCGAQGIGQLRSLDFCGHEHLWQLPWVACGRHRYGDTVGDSQPDAISST